MTCPRFSKWEEAASTADNSAGRVLVEALAMDKRWDCLGIEWSWQVWISCVNLLAIAACQITYGIDTEMAPSFFSDRFPAFEQLTSTFHSHLKHALSILNDFVPLFSFSTPFSCPFSSCSTHWLSNFSPAYSWMVKFHRSFLPWNNQHARSYLFERAPPQLNYSRDQASSILGSLFRSFRSNFSLQLHS